MVFIKICANHLAAHLLQLLVYDLHQVLLALGARRREGHADPRGHVAHELIVQVLHASETPIRLREHGAEARCVRGHDGVVALDVLVLQLEEGEVLEGLVVDLIVAVAEDAFLEHGHGDARAGRGLARLGDLLALNRG